MTNDEHETLLLAAVLRATRNAAAFFTRKPGWSDSASLAAAFETVGESVFCYLCAQADGEFCNGVFDMSNADLKVAREESRTFIDKREADPAFGKVDDALTNVLDQFTLFYKNYYVMAGYSEQETKRQLYELADRLSSAVYEHLNEYVRPGQPDAFALPQDEWPDIIDD